MDDTNFHIQPWSPKTQQIADSIMKQIKEVAPELEVLFMGAAALGLPGKNDIDLDILCDASDINTYTEELIPILGKPKVAKNDFTAWEFKLHGFDIDAILSDPKISHVPLQRKRFEILRDSPDLCEAYRKFKVSCDGLPYDEYEKRKIAFLEEKVYSNSNQSDIELI